MCVKLAELGATYQLFRGSLSQQKLQQNSMSQPLMQLVAQVIVQD